MNCAPTDHFITRLDCGRKPLFQMSISTRPPESRQDQFTNKYEFFLYLIIQLYKQLLVGKYFSFPYLAIYIHQFSKFLSTEFQSAPVNILVSGYAPDGVFNAVSTTIRTVNNPLQHAHILPVSGPYKFPVLILAKPVDSKNRWRIGNSLSKIQPVIKIVGHVIAAKRQHCKWVAPDLPNLTCSRGGCL